MGNGVVAFNHGLSKYRETRNGKKIDWGIPELSGLRGWKNWCERTWIIQLCIPQLFRIRFQWRRINCANETWFISTANRFVRCNKGTSWLFCRRGWGWCWSSFGVDTRVIWAGVVELRIHDGGVGDNTEERREGFGTTHDHLRVV